MRRPALLLIVLVLGLVAGCAGETASPTPTPAPSPTPVPATAVPTPLLPATPSGPASCVESPLDFPAEPRIPPVMEDDHVHGPADASITFMEYADFQCPGCAALSSLREFLQEMHGDDIRFVYRHLPLISIHDKAVITAEAAEAAGAQGKFWEMHDLLYERQEEWNILAEDEMQPKLVEYAEELGLDTDRFAQELEDGVYRDKIMADYEAYQEYGMMATPTYVVNNVFYPQMGLHPVLIEAFVGLVLNPPEQYDEVPPQVVDPDKKYTATIRTSKGDIVAELFPDQALTNVNSFVFLAQDGWYDDQAFFFVRPGLVAQSGDPTNIGLGLSYPGYYCGDEISPDLTFDEAGVLAMFASAPDQNSSQFFITYAPQPDLDGQYTIIGRVIEGMDVAESLTPTEPGLDQPTPDVIEEILIEEE
jgi:cyclophilin family peptidyl-prolyl cis-trans isomerase